MALPSELESYYNEKQFINESLIPLLQRLGFSVVVQNPAF